MEREEIDKEQLLKYLRGEIPFEQWVQGQQIYEQKDEFSVKVEPGSLKSLTEEYDDEDDEEDGEEGGEGGSDDEGIIEEKTGPTASATSDPEVRMQEDDKEDLGQMMGTSDMEMSGDNAMNFELQLLRASRRKQGHVSPGHLPKRRRKRSRVPKALRGLMGEAHLCFARKNHDQATKMCMEIIRQAPRSVEPFQLLGMIYEDLGDMEKSIQFQLIAAHVTPKDTEQWQQLAETCVDRNDLKKAVYCYTKALRFSNDTIPLLHARANLYTQLGEQKRAMESYQSIIKALPPEESHKCLQLARDIVKTCHNMGDVSMAINTLEMIFSKQPHLISSEDVNNLAELYISTRQFQRAIQVMCDQCGIKVEVNNVEMLPIQESEHESLTVFIPEGLPIDIRIKLAICLIHSRHLSSADQITQPLFKESPEEMGDLYLDVAEAYVDINHYKEARPILAALLTAKNYNLPAVWLRFAECLNSMGELAEASKAYKEVLQQVPRHLDARLALAAIEQQLGRAESALQALTLDPIDDQALSKQDVQLLFRQCTLLHTQGHSQEFVEKGLSLIAKYLHKDQEEYANYSVISKAEWFGLIQKICQSLGCEKRHSDAHGLITRALDSNIFEREKDPDKFKKLKFMLVCASFLHGKYDTAFYFIREFVNKWGEKTNLMNLFSLIVNNTIGTRHYRFCLRLTIKLYPDSPALSVINGHNALQTGSYKHAIGEYVRAYHYNPSDPFLSLCIGVSLFALASQKFTVNKDSIIAQAFSCLRLYQKLRGDNQETNFNIGRALHQVALTHLAVHYYQKALNLPPIIPHDARFNLQPQIAFNLSLIYRQSGNLEMAHELLQTYCIV